MLFYQRGFSSYILMDKDYRFGFMDEEVFFPFINADYEETLEFINQNGYESDISELPPQIAYKFIDFIFTNKQQHSH